MASREQKLKYLREQYGGREYINKILKNYSFDLSVSMLYNLSDKMGYDLFGIENDPKGLTIAKEIEQKFRENEN